MGELVRVHPESVSKSPSLAPGVPTRPFLAYGSRRIAFAYLVKSDRTIVGHAYADKLSVELDLSDSYTTDLALTPKRQIEDDIDYTGYLRASASTFDFWDNDLDAEYDNDV